MSGLSSKSQRRIAPLSIRLNETERRRLAILAGDMPVSTYVKSIVLAPNARPARYATADARAFSRLLAELGRSGLASNLDRIVRQAEAGTLYCDQSLLDQLRAACADVRSIRALLMDALGKYAPAKDLRPSSVAIAFGKVAGQAVRS